MNTRAPKASNAQAKKLAWIWAYGRNSGRIGVDYADPTERALIRYGWLEKIDDAVLPLWGLSSAGMMALGEYLTRAASK